jgi:predicted alpha/beta superfamily hydrolase
VPPPQFSKKLDRSLTLSVYLPPGYDETNTRHPVAYIFDGQNVFDDFGSFSGGWHLHHALDVRSYLQQTVPVVVAIHHNGNREIELSPWPVEDGQNTRLNDLLYYLRHELHPMMQANFRLIDAPEYRLIGGSSLGGLAALYGFFRDRDFYGRGLVMSPSLWVAEGRIFEYVARAKYTGEPKLYIDCGQLEAEGIVIEHAQWMADLLKRKGFKAKQHFYFRRDPRGDHNEKAWRKRLPQALNYLYGQAKINHGVHPRSNE